LAVKVAGPVHDPTIQINGAPLAASGIKLYPNLGLFAMGHRVRRHNDYRRVHRRLLNDDRPSSDNHWAGANNAV